MAVFQPNLTSRLLLKAASSRLSVEHARVLELGCGSGWITNQLIGKHPSYSREYFLSDISEEAVVEANKNLVPPLLTSNLKTGDGFAPWAGCKFDFVINDIAGIADEIAMSSNWYDGVPFSAGADGLMNTRRVLTDLSNHLEPNGVFIAPVISLSNVSEYRKLLSESFQHVVFDYKTPWPLPEPLAAQKSVLQKLEKEGNITLEEKYGKILVYTEVCICRSLKNGSIHGEL